MKRVKSGRNFRRKEPTQKMRESRYDSYHTTKKLSGPTLCTQCGAVFAKGRWSWQEKPVEFGKTVCPACQRIEDQYPAGIIHLNGEFMNSNRKEILQLIRNTERVEKVNIRWRESWRSM
jgi:NMD protein affecting ribosome stability and mRNA decay